MKHRGKDMVTLMAGILAGIAMAGPVANATSEFFQAQRTPHPVYVDGRQVQMETYAINGHNYVKLRDIGEMVDFEVYWDGSAAQIISNHPYTGQPPVQSPVPTTTSTTPDYSAQANPSVFTDELTPEIYKAVRDTVVNREKILDGQEPISMGTGVIRNSSLENALAGMGKYPIYELLYRDNGYVCNVRYPEAYHEAAAHTQDFVDSLKELTDREKAEAICWYVEERLAYETVYASPGKVLSQDGEVPGNCMAYSSSFQFLCNRVGIPSVLISSQTHQWTMAYVEGQWWDVDVTAEEGIPPELRENAHIMTDPVERYGADFEDRDPAATRFAQEALVPGSTK